MLTEKADKTLKVALIHDWLNGYRGGEKVLDALCELFPSAEIFTLFYRPESVSPRIASHKIHVSPLNGLPLVNSYYRYLIPLFPLLVERFELSQFDLVISSSHCVAKGVIVPPDSLHLCYCHTPMRYAWDRYRDYFPHSIKEWFTSPVFHYLRIWDVASSARVDRFFANSYWVKKRIAKYYHRDSQVIHPFVDLNRFRPHAGDLGNYFLVVSAFAPYKRIDLAIDACNQLGKPLFIVGSGQDEKKLRRRAGKTITFLGRQSEEEILELYAGAVALLFPGEEDFGMAPLESMASGRPVIAYGRGGVLETVVPGVTGLFFPKQSTDSLCRVILQFEEMKCHFSPQACREQAMKFRRELFLEKFRSGVNELLGESLPENSSLFSPPKEPEIFQR